MYTSLYLFALLGDGDKLGVFQSENLHKYLDYPKWKFWNRFSPSFSLLYSTNSVKDGSPGPDTLRFCLELNRVTVNLGKMS